MLSPFYNIVFALLACTGLLVGNFNRRGQAKLISYSILGMVLIQALDLVFGNLAVKSLYWLPMMYLNLLIPLGVCIYLLFFYNPQHFIRRKNLDERTVNG